MFGFNAVACRKVLIYISAANFRPVFNRALRCDGFTQLDAFHTRNLRHKNHPSRLLDAPDHKLPFLTGIKRADTTDHAVNRVSLGEQKVGKIRIRLASIAVIEARFIRVSSRADSSSDYAN